jgi:hypothetical protein
MDSLLAETHAPAAGGGRVPAQGSEQLYAGTEINNVPSSGLWSASASAEQGSIAAPRRRTSAPTFGGA